MYENNEPYNFTTDPEANRNNNENTQKENEELSESASETEEKDALKEENTVYSGYNANEENASAYSSQQNNGQQWGENGQNPYGAYNQQYGQYQYNPYPQQAPIPPKKKKSGNGGLVAGLLVAALVIGGAGGFGGSYLARRLDGGSVSSGEQTSAPGNTEPGADRPTEKPDDGSGDNTEGFLSAPEYIKPENEVNNDLSGLSNMASVNTSTEYSYKQLYDKVNESVVLVTTYVTDNSGDYQKYGTGSGIIFTTDGYIVTNNHVIEDAENTGKITVTVDDRYSDNVEMEAVLVGIDSATDLAILKIARDQPFTAAALGDSDKLDIGQEVCAIGAPLGLKKSITNGIVSGLNRYTPETRAADFSICTAT